MAMKSILALCLLAASSCAPREASTAYNGPTEPMATIVQRINQNNAPIRSLYASHSFEALLYDDKGKGHAFSGDGRLLFRKPDDLLLKAKGVVDFFEVGSNADRYWFTVYPGEVSTQWWGEKSRFTQSKASQIPIRPDLLLEVLGVLDLDTNFMRPPAPTMRFNNDADAYMFVWAAPLPDRWVALKEVWYDRRTALPKLVLLFDENGRIVLRAYLSEHRDVEGIQGKIATRFELYFPETRSRLSFRLLDVRSQFQRGKATLPNDASFAFPEDPGVEKRIEIK